MDADEERLNRMRKEWCELDEAMIITFQSLDPVGQWPWLSSHPRVKAAWEALTRPEHLADLEFRLACFGDGAGVCDWAVKVTRKATEVCRSRATTPDLQLGGEETSVKASEIFRPGWMMFGLPDLRPSNSTYEQTDYNSLPQVPRIDPGLAWLTPLHPSIDETMSDYRPDDDDREEYTRNRERIMEEARELGLALPDAFVRLTGSFELQDRIPSCTACYFDLPETIIASPFRAGDRLIRFLNDQQVCVCWYLYLPSDEPPFVISSSGDDDEPLLDSIDFENAPGSVEAARNSSALAARSFDEFLYRFWIENSIWFHLDRQLPLTPPQLDYVRSIDPGYRDPNAA